MSDLPPGGMPPAGPAPIPPHPAMVPNPAYQQWQQMAVAQQAQQQQRQQQFLAACELIRGDAAARYKIDIEADSTVAADEQAEKQARIEFLTAITPFLETVLPQMMGNPALAPLGKELVMFAVRGFRVSRSLEDAFETALDALAKMPPQQPGAGGPGRNTKSPMEIQADVAETQTKAQAAQQANAVKLLTANIGAQVDREKMAIEQQKDAAELAMQGRQMQGREALEVARMQHMAARDMQGLV